MDRRILATLVLLLLPAAQAEIQPQRNLSDLTLTVGNTVSNATNYSAAQISQAANSSLGGLNFSTPQPEVKTRRFFWTAVVFLGGFIMMGWAVGGTASRFRPELLFVIGLFLVFMGMVFGGGA